MLDEYVGELSEWLRIPSVSADPVHAPDVRRAGQWLCDYVRAAGAAASLLETDAHPLAVGELRASRDPERAPTVLLYGHFDVQPPAPIDLWDTPPFDPAVTNGHLVARGAVDDKGGLYMLLRGAADLARAGELPVNVRVVADGEEEIAGSSVVDWVRDDARGADACLVFDSGMARPNEPAFVIGTRGALAYELHVRTGARDVHSGIGNTVLNAVHVLMELLGTVLPRDGRLPQPLRAGATPPSEADRASWRLLKPGEEWLGELGAVPHDESALEEFHLRTAFEPSVDVNGILAGKPGLVNTTVPATAQANFVFRLAPGQDVDTFAAAVERLVRAAAPPGAEVELRRLAAAAPGATDPDEPAVRLAADAFERVLGARPLNVRAGGTLPILSALSARGIPTVVTGFGLPDSNAHAPNERLRLEYLDLGVEAARATLTAFAALDPH